MNNNAKYLPKTNKRCECGGTLRTDFPGAYMCDSCKYYECKGRVLMYCDGTSSIEFTVEEYILYKGVPYKAVRREANVDELVMLNDETVDKRIHKVVDFGGHYKRSVELENGEILDNYHYYRVLVPLCEVSK